MYACAESVSQGMDVWHSSELRVVTLVKEGIQLYMTTLQRVVVSRTGEVSRYRKVYCPLSERDGMGTMFTMPCSSIDVSDP